MEPLQLATALAAALDKKKAQDIVVLRVEDVTVVTEYLVIAGGTSTTHVKALADEAEFQLKQQGVAPLRTEGFDSRGWFVLDYGSVIVHVFDKEAREYYNLEHLWADGTPVPMSFDEPAK